MIAGLNIRVRVWRITQRDDDYVGGASITGTVVCEDVLARMQAEEEEQLVLQQGLETTRVFSVVCIPSSLDIKERDEIEVTEPYDHRYHGDRFRVISVRYSDHNPRDPRGYIMLKANRSVRAHSQQ